MQSEVLPPALLGRDVAAQAATGSGKTLAFVVPAVCLALEHRGRSKRPTILVLTPTRELAAQVADVAREVAQPLGLRVAACYGGTPIPKQEKRLSDGVDLLIATPGRLIDLHERGAVAFDEVRLAVVDEADRMADMGFAPQVDWLLRRLPATRQTILCSATLAGDVARLSENWLDDPVVVGVEERSSAPGQLVHRFLYVHGADKDRVAARLIRSYGRCVVFCDTKRDTDRVARRLADLDVSVAALHGDLQQKMRERALDAFSAGKVEAIVATDVAAVASTLRPWRASSSTSPRAIRRRTSTASGARPVPAPSGWPSRWWSGTRRCWRWPSSAAGHGAPADRGGVLQRRSPRRRRRLGHDRGVLRALGPPARLSRALPLGARGWRGKLRPNQGSAARSASTIERSSSSATGVARAAARQRPASSRSPASASERAIASLA